MKRKFEAYQGAYPCMAKRKKVEDDEYSDDDDFNECKNSISSKCNNVYSVDNHIYFNSAFNKKSVEMLVDEIKNINEKFQNLKNNSLVETIAPKPIYIHITSFGGSLLHCFKAIDACNRSSIEIHTVVEGYAASCGSLLAVVGKRRYMGKFSSILMHQLSSGAIGKYGEIEDEYHNCKMWMENIINIYETHTNMTKEQIEQQLQHDSWWGYDVCLTNGLIDGECVG